MKTTTAAATRNKLRLQIAAIQKQSEVAKKTAKLAKLSFRNAKQKFKDARRAAKKLRKELKVMKAQLVELSVKKTRRKPAAAKVSSPKAIAKRPAFIVAPLPPTSVEEPTAPSENPPIESPPANLSS